MEWCCACRITVPEVVAFWPRLAWRHTHTQLCAVVQGNADYMQQQARPLLTHLCELLNILPGLLAGVVQCSLQLPPVYVRRLGPFAQGLPLNLCLLELLLDIG